MGKMKEVDESSDIVARLREHHELILLRDAAAEIERLRKDLTYEENRFRRQGTHAPGCWQWGPSHYECAMGKVERLREALKPLAELFLSPDDMSYVPDDIERNDSVCEEVFVLRSDIRRAREALGVGKKDE